MSSPSAPVPPAKPPQHHWHPPHIHFSYRFGAVIGIFIVLALIASRLDFHRDLHHLRIGVLSGSQEGHYYAIVDDVAKAAAAKRGAVTNISSEGSLDNITKLAAAAKTCDVQFALVQDGLDWPKDGSFQLIGRLPKAESLLLLGRKADAMTSLADLAHARIGIGPAGSGAARIAHQLFDSRDFAPLGLVLSNHPLAEQLDLVIKGELDLALLVMDEDAPLVQSAIRDRGLQIASLAHGEALARVFPHLKPGTIAAGEYDAVRVLPATDKTVLRVETLVAGNGCAGRSQVVGLMSLLSGEFPDFVRYNRETPNQSGLDLAPAATGYFEHQGPEVADQYAPWLVDIMPPGNWAYVVMAVSLVFNAMAAGHRFQLYRIDAERVKIERELTATFGPTTTMGDIARMEPSVALLKPEMRQAIRHTIVLLEALNAKSRKYSVSFLVPMGQEMGYRYQESLIHEMLSVLRGFLARCEASDRRAA